MQRRTQHYVRRCAEALGISYNFEVKTGKLAATSEEAEIEQVDACSYVITVNDAFNKALPKRKREVVAHELMHTLTWPLTRLVPNSHSEECEEVEELLVNTLEKLISRLLPEWRYPKLLKPNGMGCS